MSNLIKVRVFNIKYDTDGYYFKDSSSGKLVSISGTVIITQE